MRLPAKKAAKSGSGGGTWENIKVITQAILIAVVIRTFLFQPFNIPSSSLVPTLLVGDYLFVSKFSYGYSRYSFPFGLPGFSGRVWSAEPQRGDVAVFKLPRDNSTDYIKRVIGLPGDRIQMIDGHLHINGEPVKKEKLGGHRVNAGAGHSDEGTLYQETLPNGVSYTVQELEKFGNKLGRNTDVYTVPPNHYFMMGDNRDNSLDSRDMGPNGVGFVPFDNFVGRAEIVFFSISEDSSVWKVWEWPWAVRWSRILSQIQNL